MAVKYFSGMLLMVFQLYVLWRVLRHAPGLSFALALLTVVPLTAGVYWIAMRLLRESQPGKTH